MNLKAINYGDYLMQYKIKPSYLRIKIIEYLAENKNHPSVDQIFKELSTEVPTLSKTTVYNSLKLFVEKGACSTVNLDETTARFDFQTKLHGHFLCEECCQIYDFQAELNSSYNELEDFDIKGMELSFKGVCKTCKQKKVEDIKNEFKRN